MIDRPDTSTLVLAIAFTAAGWLLDAWIERSSRTEVAPSESDRRPDPIGTVVEPPAVVGLLTNRFEVPNSAVTATALDLAARDWIGLGLSDGELVVVARGQGQVGDILRPFEQQVLNHLSSRAFNGVSSAATLAASQEQLDWRWWIRFRRSVAHVGQELGLTEDRYTARALAPAAACAAIGLIVTLLSIRHGVAVDLSDSWKSRLVWLIALGATVALAWRVFQRAVGAAQQPTQSGASRASLWFGYRRRLLAKVPQDASVIANHSQQATLANAVVMGVAEPVLDELPAAPEDHRSAWSEAGDSPHLVTVRYPIRPGYGQHPGKVLASGVVVLLLARWVRAFLIRVADGDALKSLIERAPGQIDVIEKIATTLAVLCWIPILWAVCRSLQVRSIRSPHVNEWDRLFGPASRSKCSAEQRSSNRSRSVIAPRPISPSTMAGAEWSLPGWPTSAAPPRRAPRPVCVRPRCSGTCGRPSRSERVLELACEVQCAPTAATSIAYRLDVAVTYNVVRAAPPNATLALGSGSSTAPSSVPSGS